MLSRSRSRNELLRKSSAYYYDDVHKQNQEYIVPNQRNSHFFSVQLLRVITYHGRKKSFPLLNFLTIET